MVALQNTRHERFAQGIAKGSCAKTAYVEAGFRASERTAEVEGSRLLRNPKVTARLVELQARHAQRLDITVERITAQLLEDRALAFSQGQASAAVAASMALAKLHGLIIDKAEIIGVVRKPMREPCEVRQMSLAEWQEKFAPKRLESLPSAPPEPKPAVEAEEASLLEAIRRAKAVSSTSIRS